MSQLQTSQSKSQTKYLRCWKSMHGIRTFGDEAVTNRSSATSLMWSSFQASP